jgi:hypothetical protein
MLREFSRAALRLKGAPHLFFSAAVLSSVLCGPQAYHLMGAGEISELELQVKAVFVVSFAKFTQWPESTLPASAPIKIGVVGPDAICPFLEQAVAGKTTDGHSVVIRKIKSIEEARGYHILFFGAPFSKEINGWHLARIWHRSTVPR